MELSLTQFFQEKINLKISSAKNLLNSTIRIHFNVDDFILGIFM